MELMRAGMQRGRLLWRTFLAASAVAAAVTLAAQPALSADFETGNLFPRRLDERPVHVDDQTWRRRRSQGDRRERRIGALVTATELRQHRPRRRPVVAFGVEFEACCDRCAELGPRCREPDVQTDHLGRDAIDPVQQLGEQFHRCGRRTVLHRKRQCRGGQGRRRVHGAAWSEARAVREHKPGHGHPTGTLCRYQGG